MAPSDNPALPSEDEEQLPDYTAHAPALQIPLALKASYRSAWSKLGLTLGGRTIQLEPTKPNSNSRSTANTPYQISLPRGFYGTIVLDHASDTTPSPLAKATPQGRRGYDVLLPGSSVAESLRRQARSNTWWFALSVGSDNEIEAFEWRRSRGKAVKQLGASRRGWKLVRTSNARERLLESVEADGDEESLPGYSSDAEQGEASSDDGLASERSDVVAVWANAGTWGTDVKQ